MNIKTPVNLSSEAFTNNKHAHFRYLLEEAPVHKAKVMTGLSVYAISRYEDVDRFLKDKSLVRDRTSLGKSPFPFPLPKSVQLLASGMINKDDPEHQRLRRLVSGAFTPAAIKKLSQRIEVLADELVHSLKDKSTIDLRSDFAHPIPVAMIAEMVGIEKDEVPKLAQSMASLTEGFSGLRILKTIAFDLPAAVEFLRTLIARKKQNPGNDILTALIQAEDDEGALSDDELVAMVFVLIIAGHETTFNLITNAVHALLTHKEQLKRLQEDAGLMPSAIEEVLRHSGPIYGTKGEYSRVDLELHGVRIPKGKMIMNLVGAANLDPSVFKEPERFDIARDNNRHFGFGVGPHFCLGASLARLETKVALSRLFEHFPNLSLQDPSNLVLNNRPGWHEFKALPVNLR